MRMLRIILQVIIVALGLLFTVVAFGSSSALASIGVFVFFSVLFLFSLLLREHTESHLVPGRKFNPKVRGAFLALPGISLCWVAWSFSFGRTVPLGWQNQDVASLFGTVGFWALALVLFLVGIQVLWLSYRVFRSAA